MKKKLFITIVVYLLLYFKTSVLIAQGQESWSLPIRVMIENQTFHLVLGVSPEATELYDQELDQLTAPPPGVVPYAFLEIRQFPYFLQKDIRPDLDEIVWILRIMDTQGQEVRVEWDIPDFFNNHSAGDPCLLLNHEMDMLNMDGITVEGDTDFVIICLKNQTEASYSLYDFGYYPSMETPYHTRLWIHLPDTSHVIFEIWNRHGDVLCRWQNNDNSIRSYQFEWDGKDGQGNVCQGGVYIGKLQTKAQILIKKILLLP